MVVAGPGVTHLLVEFRLWLKPWRSNQRDVHNAFKHVADMGARQPVVAMTSLLHRHDNPRRGQFAEMAARSLRRYSGGVGQFSRGERTAAEQGAQHIGPRR